jgi:hemin uptake protein HemP
VSLNLDPKLERTAPARPAAQQPARVSSESLLGACGELLIVHNGREYRLRLTQNGKLILTA